jgi:hypothetical protein
MIVLVSFLLTSCASTNQYQSYPNLNAEKTPTATVHVVRSISVVGLAMTAPVFIDRYRIGSIGPGGYLKTQVPLGRVHVTSTTADVMVQTENNSQYFFEVSMPAQVWLYAPDFNVFAIDRGRAIEILGFDPLAKNR